MVERALYGILVRPRKFKATKSQERVYGIRDLMPERLLPSTKALTKCTYYRSETENRRSFYFISSLAESNIDSSVNYAAMSKFDLIRMQSDALGTEYRETLVFITSRQSVFEKAGKRLASPDSFAARPESLSSGTSAGTERTQVEADC